MSIIAMKKLKLKKMMIKDMKIAYNSKECA
jgi:hypothetical protein